MKPTLLSFFKFVIAFIVCCVLLQYYFDGRAAADLVLKTNYALLVVTAVGVIGAHVLLVTGNEGNSSAFIRKFMLITVLKFFFHIITVVLFYFLANENPRALIAYFLLYYLGFTVIEITFLYQEIKPKQKAT